MCTILFRPKLVLKINADEVDELFLSAGLIREQLHVDRRLQMNRGRQFKMYRIWIQAKYRKPEGKKKDSESNLTQYLDAGDQHF